MNIPLRYLALALMGAFLLGSAEAAPAKKKKRSSVFPDVTLAESQLPDVEAAAEAGDTAALHKLGHYYMQQAQDAKGREYLLKAAEAGSAEARAWYAQAVYQQHNCSETGKKLALEQAKLAAEAGSPLGLYFCAQFGVDDKAYARECMEKASRKGFAPAMRLLAREVQQEVVGAPEREQKKFLNLYDKAIKAGDITSIHAGTGKSGYIFERFPFAKTNSMLRKSIELAKKRQLCWYDTCLDFDFAMRGFAHGGARYYLVILGYKALEHAASKEKNKMAICTKNRKELYSYLEKQAENGDPAACHAIISLIQMPHLFWTCRPDASFSNPDVNYWKNKAEELKKTAAPLYRRLHYPSL